MGSHSLVLSGEFNSILWSLFLHSSKLFLLTGPLLEEPGDSIPTRLES